MKKLYLILALFLFTGSFAVSSYAAINGKTIELKDDDKKKKKKRKKGKKSACAKSKSCASSSKAKSCCSKDKTNLKKDILKRQKALFFMPLNKEITKKKNNKN